MWMYIVCGHVNTVRGQGGSAKRWAVEAATSMSMSPHVKQERFRYYYLLLCCTPPCQFFSTTTKKQQSVMKQATHFCFSSSCCCCFSLSLENSHRFLFSCFLSSWWIHKKLSLVRKVWCLWWVVQLCSAATNAAVNCRRMEKSRTFSDPLHHCVSSTWNPKR